MKFECFIDARRFWFILPYIVKSGMISNVYPEKIRKTACLYSEKINVYIDSSDGIASDFGVPEYCDRILKIVEDSKGKPFLFFKPWYSPTLCKSIESVAKENNGKVIPFMYWADWDHFIQYLWPNKGMLYKRQKDHQKSIDIGACVRVEKRVIPKPSSIDNRVSWIGYNWFKMGDEQPDQGYYEHDARIRLNNQLLNSSFTYEQIENVSFKDYVDRSMSWKALVDMPGIGCVSHRMFENGWIGQCVILKKNDVDFPYSWKDYYPEVDFYSDGWEEKVSSILENYQDWGDKIRYYLETYCNSETISNYFIQKVIEEIEIQL